MLTTSNTGQKLYPPSSISIGSDGVTCVADFGNNRIVRMSDMTGADWQSIDNLDHPISVRVADDGRLYVGLADRRLDLVSRIGKAPRYSVCALPLGGRRQESQHFGRIGKR